METETRRDYDILPSRSLLRAPDPDKNLLLLINLTKLNSSEEAQLIGHLRESVKHEDGKGPTALIQLWCPPESTLLLPLGDKRNYIIKRYYKDSKANIFGLAVLANRAGYESFVVADGYSERELRGELLPAGITGPGGHSVVTVRIRSVESEDSAQNDHKIRVIARRTLIGKNRASDLCSCIDKQDTCIDVIGRGYITDFEQLFKLGVELHDPSRGVFDPSTAAGTGRDEFDAAARVALSESTPLPIELINQTVGWLYDSGEAAFGIPSVLREDRLNIFLLFPTGEDERRGMQSELQQEVERYIRELEEDQENEAKRAEDSTDTDGETSGEDDEDSENNIARMVRYALSYPTAMFRAVEIRRAMKESQHEEYDPSEIELLHEPELPIYRTPSLSRSVVWELATEHIQLFLLTNKLTEEQLRKLRDEVQTLADSELGVEDLTKSCNMIPWKDGNKHTPGGSEDDIWKLFCELRDEGCGLPSFLADKRSGIDRKVIMVDIDAVPTGDDNEKPTELMGGVCEPDLRGLLYGRIEGREALTTYLSLNRGVRVFADFFPFPDDIHTYPRPGRMLPRSGN
ncbi:uncharacterized protein BJX67DRAFT_378166 [Aspergillus lucknowensis]|uniref:Uncharacterized protein n=1 Tax=Aspergillus lucknowensis TaxID=176173 RepID=A0ABR4M218_9EURO